MLGVFFIALNRILAPAFYAQSDTKSPTLAGLLSFAVNILLAAVLVGPFRGAGIAFALSIASAVNTLVLLIFLKRKPNIALGSAFTSVPLYILKLSVFSALAVALIYFLSPYLLGFFAGRGRIVSYGIPLGINLTIYIMIGFTMLTITRDQYFLSVIKLFRKKKQRELK
jgi:putative peptidoglycan lipid II flippase